MEGWQALYRELWTSQARALLANSDARHLVVCTDCGIARHERDDPYDYPHDRCPVCEGQLVPAADSPGVLPPLAESIAAIRDQLARLGGRR